MTGGFVRRWPTEQELRTLDTAELSALANRLGVGRWIMDLPTDEIRVYLLSKIIEVHERFTSGPRT